MGLWRVSVSTWVSVLLTGSASRQWAVSSGASVNQAASVTMGKGLGEYSSLGMLGNYFPALVTIIPIKSLKSSIIV